MNTTGVYHININCTEMERSLAFYEMLGFKVAIDFNGGGGDGGPQPDVLEALRRPGANARATLLQLGDDPRSCHIDLIEWIEPKTEGKPYEHLSHTGIARVCLYTKDIWSDYEELKSKGVEFYTEPKVIRYPGGESLIVCFEDPDGTVVEFVQYRRTAGPRA